MYKYKVEQTHAPYQNMRQHACQLQMPIRNKQNVGFMVNWCVSCRQKHDNHYDLRKSRL